MYTWSHRRYQISAVTETGQYWSGQNGQRIEPDHVHSNTLNLRSAEKSDSLLIVNGKAPRRQAAKKNRKRGRVRGSQDSTVMVLSNSSVPLTRDRSTEWLLFTRKLKSSGIRILFGTRFAM